MRLKFDKNAINKLEKTKYLVKNYPLKLDENTILEIGMGKGEMLTNMAFYFPTKKFIGLEKFSTVAAKAIINANKYELNNFQIVINVALKINEIFTGKTNEIWLTFSDPWPKKKHEKRRLTYKTYLKIYEQILQENGFLKIKTDNDNFFNYSINSLQENNWTILKQTNDFHSHQDYDQRFQTNYEIKWSSQGKNINYLVAKKPN